MSQTRFLFFLEMRLCMCVLRGHALISSSVRHIKTGQHAQGPLFSSLFKQIFTVMDTFSFAGGGIQSCTLCFCLTETSVNQLSDFSGSFRKILLPFNKQSGPPGWGQENTERQRREQKETQRKPVPLCVLSVCGMLWFFAGAKFSPRQWILV